MKDRETVERQIADILTKATADGWKDEQGLISDNRLLRRALLFGGIGFTSLTLTLCVQTYDLYVQNSTQFQKIQVLEKELAINKLTAENKINLIKPTLDLSRLEGLSKPQTFPINLK